MTAREIAALFEDLELRLIASLKRNLARHKAEEKDEGFDWPAWQAEKLHSLQRFRRENKYNRESTLQFQKSRSKLSDAFPGLPSPARV